MTLAVGLGLRLLGLTRESFWLDEGFSALLAKQGLLELIVSSAQDVHPPFYYILLHFWILLFGDSEFSIRLMSALAATAAIPALFALGRRLFNTETALLASVILSFAPFHIAYSQEARMYSLMTLLTLLSMYSMAGLLQDRRKSDWFGYLAFSGLLLYTHAFGLLIVLAQNVFFLVWLAVGNAEGGLEKPPRKLGRALEASAPAIGLRAWLALQAGLALLFAPWVPVLFNQVALIQSGYWIDQPEWLDLLRSYSHYSGYPAAGALLSAGALLGLLSTRFGSSPSLRETSGLKQWAGVLLLTCWCVIPLAFTFFISRLSTPVFIDRVNISASLGFFLLAALGFTAISRPRWRYGLLVVLIGLSLVRTREQYEHLEKAQWRQALGYLRENWQAGDILFSTPGYAVRVVEYYFEGRGGSRVFFDGSPCQSMDTRRKDRFWVLRHASARNFDPNVACLQDYLTVEKKEYLELTLYLFAKKAAGS